MGILLATLFLLPGALSLAIATRPRCRAVAPRDVPAAITVTAVLTVADFSLAWMICRMLWKPEFLASKSAALIAGSSSSGYSRGQVLEELMNPTWHVVAGTVALVASSLMIGRFAAWSYVVCLRQTAVEDGAFNGRDPRSQREQFVAGIYHHLGVTHLATARGASYWLVIKQVAQIMSDDNPRVFADISQGEPFTLYRGQVNQVIASPSGEVQSVVIKFAERLVRTLYTPISDEGHRKVVKKGFWSKIGDSEAFYIDGQSVSNISYRVYGAAEQAKDQKQEDGIRWTIPGVVEKFPDGSFTSLDSLEFWLSDFDDEDEVQEDGDTQA